MKLITIPPLPLLLALLVPTLACAQATKPKFTTSDGSPFIVKDNFPPFSWDTTQRYFMFGNKNKVLDSKSVKFVADRTNFICIEKSHGLKQFKHAEIGTRHEAAALKKANPKIKVLFYFNAAYAWPYTSYNDIFSDESLAKNPKHKEFLVVHPKTKKFVERFGVYCFDVLNPEFRTWWSDTVAKGMKETGCDGVFIDQMHGNTLFGFRKEKENEVAIAMGEMMASLKQKIGKDKILLANNANKEIGRHVVPVSDALMFENYAKVKYTKESLLEEWGQMLQNAKAGKISVFRFGVDGTWRGNIKPNMVKLSKEKLEFAHACYLIGAQPYTYFLYSWGWKTGTGAMIEYPSLKNPLGPPKGAYKRVKPNGWEFTREFQHASVWVNTESREAKITWKKP